MRIWLIGVFTVIASSLFAQQSIANYTLGHSLLNYNVVPPYGDENSVPYWLHSFSVSASHSFTTTGQYGFLPQHRIYSNWYSNWGYAGVPTSWDSEMETFAESSVDNIILTAGNFLQNSMAPDDNYYGENFSPLSCTQVIVDTVNMSKPDLKFYIYENWPEMGGFTNEMFPPTEAQFQAYDNYTQTTFHDWWIDYHDLMMASHQLDSVRLIPVGPILGRLFTDTLLTNIPYTDIYIDADPHGTPNLYFLAAMVTYMAIYQEPCPANPAFSQYIHQDIIDNYADVNTYIWNELQTYTDANGNSRVFFGSTGSGGGGTSSTQTAAKLEGGAFFIDNPDGIILKGQDSNCYQIYIGANGLMQTQQVTCPQN